MPAPFATLVFTGLQLDHARERLAPLFPRARSLCPEGFPFDETRELDAIRADLTYGFIDELRRELSARLALAPELFSLDRFTVQGAGPVSLHDDRRNYPDWYFVIVVVHSGRLGIVDQRSRARRHDVGEVFLLDPRRKHALVPAGLRARDWPCAREAGHARDAQDQFLFLDFELPRTREVRERFRA
ncbi:MAG TPA: hypothetical protein VLW45_05355 [Pelomicrobium sp.]|nr:hypothetical protein [Pelomicrobium sp.]